MSERQHAYPLIAQVAKSVNKKYSKISVDSRGILWQKGDVSKKTTTSPQVRLDPGLFSEIETIRASFRYKMSRPAFVEALIRAGIAEIKRENKPEAG